MNNKIKSRSTFMLSTLETDFQGTMKLGAFCNRMQEIAWQDAALNGFGYDALKEQNLLWLLSRFHIEIDRLPEWRETVHLSTWAKKVESLFAIRDFILEDQKGNILCRVTSSWVVIDYETKRIRRPNAIKELPASFTDLSALNTTSPKLGKPVEPEMMKLCRAEYCDLDIVGHLNNTKYVDWVQNSFPLDKYRHQSVKSFKINFLSEVLGGHEVELYASKRQESNEIWLIEGRNLNKEDVSFRAEIEWNRQ